MRPLGKGFIVEVGAKFGHNKMFDRIEPGGNNDEMKALTRLYTRLLESRNIATTPAHLSTASAPDGPIITGPWSLQDAKLQDYHGAGLYRARFTVPAAWKGRTITLNMYSFNSPIVYDKGEFFLNGRKVTDVEAHPGSQTLNYDVTKLLREGENVLSVKVQGGKELSGVAGNVWLEPERALSETVDLSGQWQAVAADYLTRTAMTIPGGTRAKYIERDFTVPAAWAKRQVFAHIELPQGQRMKGVVINGRPIVLNTYVHPFGLRTEINISPYLRFGQQNHIQIWPWGTIPAQRYGVAGEIDSIDIAKIIVGVAS